MGRWKGEIRWTRSGIEICVNEMKKKWTWTKGCSASIHARVFGKVGNREKVGVVCAIDGARKGERSCNWYWKNFVLYLLCAVCVCGGLRLYVHTLTVFTSCMTVEDKSHFATLRPRLVHLHLLRTRFLFCMELGLRVSLFFRSRLNFTLTIHVYTKVGVDHFEKPCVYVCGWTNELGCVCGLLCTLTWGLCVPNGKTQRSRPRSLWHVWGVYEEFTTLTHGGCCLSVFCLSDFVILEWDGVIWPCSFYAENDACHILIIVVQLGESGHGCSGTSMEWSIIWYRIGRQKQVDAHCIE